MECVFVNAAEKGVRASHNSRNVSDVACQGPTRTGHADGYDDEVAPTQMALFKIVREG